MHKPRLAVIVDRGHLQKYQLDALNATDAEEITIFSCTNTVLRRRPVKHGLYYLLNLASVRNAHKRSVALSELRLPVKDVIEFTSGYKGAWQSLPDPIVEKLREGAFDAVFKAGMGLMRVPPADRLPVPILSFHHGDPDLYRGRPAGFYEILNGERKMGQIVQVISDTLDGGAVIAFAETRISPHSYRATLEEAFRHSHLLLPQALRNIRAGRTVAKHSQGKNDRLPSNLTVARFVLQTAGATLRRLAGRALVEKSWHVATVATDGAPADLLRSEADFPPMSEWTRLQPIRPFHSYADPFPSRSPAGLLVTASNRGTGKGEIVLVRDDGRQVPLSPAPGRVSYPAGMEENGRAYVVPDIAAWSPPRIYAVDDERLQEVGMLDVADNPAILDPTFLRRDGHLYLFGNIKELGSNALFLWHSPSLFGRFEPHPASPVRISPGGGRMAGNPVADGTDLFRLGQDRLGGKGGGLFVFRIDQLSPTEYSEQQVGEIRFSGSGGPHILNFADGRAIFDWCRERTSPLAGIRRVIGRYL